MSPKHVFQLGARIRVSRLRRSPRLLRKGEVAWQAYRQESRAVHLWKPLSTTPASARWSDMLLCEALTD